MRFSNQSALGMRVGAGTRWKGNKTHPLGKKACPDRGHEMLTPWNAPHIPQTQLGTFSPQNPRSIHSKCLHLIEYNEAHFSVCPTKDIKYRGQTVVSLGSTQLYEETKTMGIPLWILTALVKLVQFKFLPKWIELRFPLMTVLRGNIL